MTRFLDTEIAPAIKPTPKIRVKMLTQSLDLMAGTYGTHSCIKQLIKNNAGDVSVV